MRARFRIGVFLSAAIEIGRQVLFGLRQFTQENPECTLMIISEYGMPEHAEGFRIPLDGVVAHSSTAHMVEALRGLAPHLVITSNAESAPGIARVVNDDVAVGRLAFEHFYQRGYQTLAYVARPGHLYSMEREEGFRRAAAAAGLAVKLIREEAGDFPHGTLEHLRGLPDPVAVFTAADFLARAVMDAMDEARLEVPRRMAILGVDDDSLQNALSPVPLSSVRTSGARIGYEAGRLIHEIARGRAPSDKEIRIAPQFVVTRQSTDHLAIGDRIVQRAMREIRQKASSLPDVAALVKELGVPRRTLETRFRKATGYTLAVGINQARIDHARELLSTTSLSLAEISDIVGFAEPRMLSIVFRRLTGETPSAFRQRARPVG